MSDPRPTTTTPPARAAGESASTEILSRLERSLDAHAELVAERLGSVAGAPPWAASLDALRDLLREAREAAAPAPTAADDALLACLSELAHKLNNPLTSLMGRIQMLKLKQGGDSPIAKEVEVIDASARRIAEHVQELAALVRTRRAQARATR